MTSVKDTSDHDDGRATVSPYPGTHEATPMVFPEGVAYPDCLLFPLTLAPTERPVRLDIPGNSGELSRQVYEYSALYRMIYTIGTCRQSRRLYHTLNGQLCDCHEPFSLVRDVPDDVHDRIAAERKLRVATESKDPLTNEDIDKFWVTMMRMENP